MSVREQYRTALAEHGYVSDPSQEQAVDLLDEVHDRLCNEGPRRTLWQTLLRRQSRQTPVRGLYMWGGVGRGKTFIMDLFFDALPFAGKQRFHFHRLMYRVHGQLKKLKGRADPIAIIADELAADTRVICFDEFFVADIGDAMILGRLLDALFERGVSLIATSNIPPDDLYRDGLQRQRFLPAIELLKHHTHVVNLDGGNDYRLRVLEQAEIWHAPLDAAADENLDRYFSAIAPDKGTHGLGMEILGREVMTRRRADGIAWFDFAELCDGPRSQDDYIEIARAFQTVLLSNVPLMDSDAENQARRFIALVDEFYDRRVKLIVSAAHPPEQIYTGKRLAMEYRRTLSRLTEMQSVQYLGEAHLP
ncbi:MAG: AFG1 family ATPase [Gammaproteobacteria bacterium]|nr:AFG1 family ATPase [Gammaproteobacteria bacterium]